MVTTKQRFGISSNTLRYLALLFMLLDHIYHILATGAVWLNCIGRLAFPIFAFQIAEGYRHTSNVKRYKLRLLFFALLSEIPFNFMLCAGHIYPFHQNVLFTLLLGLIAIDAIEKGKTCEKMLKSWLLQIAVPLLCMAAATIGMCDYNWVGVATVMGFHLLRNYKIPQFVLLFYLNQFVLGGRVFLLFGGAIELQMQALAVLALPLIWLYNGEKGRDLRIAGRSVNIGYWFYPAHLALLCLLRFWKWSMM